MSEIPSFNPNDMHALLAKKQLAHSALQRTPETQPLADVAIPEPGKIVERAGKECIWREVRTGVDQYSSETGRFEPINHSLRSWFSHTSYVGRNQLAVNGPGWDRRRSLWRLTDEEMLAEFGHIFTREEMNNPAGTENYETGEITGGMPDDIPYLELVSLDDAEDLED